jgi:predicted dehydrogenase
MIDACAAGKHIYVEKPCGNSIGECNLMMAAQQKYGSIVQVGQWQRSQQHFKNAVDFIASGQLGKIRTVKVWCYQGWMKPQPKVPDTPIPAGVDYKRWLGPAPDRTFNPNRFHFDFRWFWDYAGGLMTDWGVHLIDYALLGMKATYPKSIVALGGEFAYPELYQETPDTLTALYEFDGFNMVWDHTCGIDNGSYNRNHGIAFIGNNATLVVDRGGWEVMEEKISKNKVVKPLEKMMDNGLLLHTKNFVDTIRSGNKQGLHCTIQDASKVATVAQMGNISYRSGQKLEWDALKNEFTNADINTAYYTKTYHNGYLLPKI